MRHAISARRTSARGAPWRPARVIASVAILLAFVGLLPLAAAGQTEPDGQSAAPVDQAVLDAVATDGTADFWAVFGDKADLSAAYGMSDWAARGQYVFDQLTSTANASQAGFTAELAARNVAYDSFYVVNAVLVRGADAATVDWARSQSGVSRIAARWEVTISDPLPAEEQARIQTLEWNIERVRADEVWDSFGTRGDGITVAHIDTGVDFEHEALVRQYRGNNGDGTFDHNYNWIDPGGDSCADAPCDTDIHGTHTMGTITGEDEDLENQIGVAPGANWISALGCPFGGCPDFDLITSGEFMLAPTDLNGENPRPDLRPQVVGNSWGSDNGSDEFYRDMVNAWVAAGVFPVFSNGNNGFAGCGTVGSPASYPESYGVGASDISDNIAGFSSKGPSPIDDGIKPNVTAPGVDVRSSTPGDSYGGLSGTSMASPHVTGTVALILSSSPALIGDIEGLRLVLDDGATDFDDTSCGGDADDNNVWGEGLLDAFASVDLAPRGPSGSLTGTVTDAVTGDPIAGATVTVVVDGRPRATRTGADGAYTFGAIPVGTWDATGSATGYRPASGTVEIVEDETTTLDFALSPLPSLSGTVTDANDGLPVAGAAITATSGGTTLTATTGDDGTYQLYLDIGTWSVTFEAEGYATETREVVAEEDGQQISLDVALRTGVASVTPTSIEAIVLSGAQRTYDVRLANTGSARLTWEAFERGGGRVDGALTWLQRASAQGIPATSNNGALARPSSARWTPNGGPHPNQGAILVYADDFYHPAPSTYVDQALQALGFEYTAFYDGNFSGFESALADGGWDLVVFEDDNFAPPASTFDALNDYVTGGGKLIAHSWQVEGFAGHPLWASMGVDVVSSDFDPPDPVHFWEADHPLFTDPNSVPEFTDLDGGRYGIYGQKVEPLSADFTALAGYTDDAAPNEAGLVLGNEDRTLFRGFLDGQNDADLDDDGVADGAEFWANSIVGIEQGFFVDVPWLDVTPDSGAVQPGRRDRLQLTIDTTGLEPGVYSASIAFATNAARVSRVSLPITLIVTPYLQGVNAGGGDYTDRNQDAFAADQAFDGSWGYEYNSDPISTTHAIGGTADDALYQDARVGRAFNYRFDNLPDGVYEVELHFAEIQQRRPGDRLFDVTADSTTLLIGYDIAEDVGRYNAVVHRFHVEVTDGRLRIRFLSRAGFGQPIINAVQLTNRPDLGN